MCIIHSNITIVSHLSEVRVRIYLKVYYTQKITVLPQIEFWDTHLGKMNNFVHD